MKLKCYLNESINDVGIYKAVFFGGSPGAGKTYVSNQIKSGSIGVRIVNTDKFLEFKKNKSWPDIGDHVKHLTTTQLFNYLNSMLPLYIDGTSTNVESIVRRIGLLEGLGYDCDCMVFINAPLDTVLKRIQSRSRKVSDDFIKFAYEKIEDLRKFYTTKFKKFIEINNDEGMLTDNVINKAFNKISSYYQSDINNPIGLKNVKYMKENNIKYLVPSIYSKDHLSKVVSLWYRE